MIDAYNIPGLIGHRASFTGESLCPAFRQAGDPGAAPRNLSRPGRKLLNAQRTRCRRQARFRTRPGRAGLVRICLLYTSPSPRDRG